MMQLSEGSNIAASSLPSASSTNLQQQQQHPQQQQSEQQVCFGCKKSITDRYLLKAVDRLWHEDCLKCSCCDCRLGEVGSTLFTRADLLLCRRDYLRLFGATGYCSICAKLIPAFEMVMRAKGNVYHLECFACQQCSHRFCVGDRYYLLDNKILCEYDYEERMMLAGQQPFLCNCSNQSNITTSSSYPDTSINNHHGKHQHMSHGTNHHLMSDDVSSGYGSPSPTSI